MTTPVTIRFAAAKGTLFKLFLIGFFLLGLGVIYVGLKRENGLVIYDWIWIVIWLSYVGMHGHRWLNTYYELSPEAITYRSGFSKGSIAINSLTHIKPRRKGIGDFRAALSGQGMELVSATAGILFVAPQEPEKLVTELLKRNPAIEFILPSTQSKEN